MEVRKNTLTNFELVMGNTPTIRLIDFLIENDRESWSMHEISIEGGLAYPTLKLILPRLKKLEMIEVVRKVGNISFYKLNEEDIRVKNLKTLYKSINKYAIEKHIKDIKK